MKNSKILFLFLAVILIVPFVSAVTSDISVKTISNYKVYIATQNPESNSLIASTIVDSGSEGKVSTAIESGSQNEMNLIIKVYLSGSSNTPLANEKFEEYGTGGKYSFLITGSEVVENYEETAVITDTSNETLVDANGSTASSADSASADSEVNTDASADSVSVEKSSSSLTGLVASVGDAIFSKVAFYIVGGLIGAVLLFVIAKNVPWGKFRSADSGVKINKVTASSIDEAEAKLREAKTQLNKIKNVERIEEAEAELRASKDKLDRLLKGED